MEITVTNQFNDIYRGKNVFVTGHTGFKGSWLALWLSKLGAKIVGYSLDVPTNPSHFKILDLNLKSIKGNVLNKNRLFKIIDSQKPEIIFHLAAQPLVRKSYLNPANTLETNIMGTANVLESARLSGHTKAIVVITSDKCYQNKEWIWGYKEDDPLGGDDPYSASKGCAELIANTYAKSFFNPETYKKTHNTLVASARAGNVIGGGDWAADRLIPDMVKAASQGSYLTIRNPNATRPWQYVLEPLSGYLLLGQKLLEGKKEFSGNWNFGPNSESNLSVQEIISESQKYWGAIKSRVSEGQSSMHESNYLMLDSTKAKRFLKWQPTWSKDKMINKTINWYKKYYETGKIKSIEDLDDYINDFHQNQN